MAFTTWKSTLSVKVEQLDQQHKRLVSMINDLYEAMKAGTGKETTATILAELIDYTMVHFADEERLLTQHGYPDIAGHILLHEVFSQQVMEYDNKIKTGCSVLTLELMMFLQTWLVGHIKCEDMKYSQFLNSNGVK
jgi:hemerythrin